MKKKKANRKGFIVKWQTPLVGPRRWYVHVYHNNKNVSDSNSYKTAGGRNKKVIRLTELYPNHQVVTNAEFKSLLKK